MAAALRAVDIRVSGHSLRWAAAAVAAVAALPLLWAAALAIAAGLDAGAWRSLLAEPQLPRALALSVGTGLAATALSFGVTAFLLSRSFPGPAWAGLMRVLAPMLAMPHAAFAIGLVFLLSPSGWILRAVSPWATGFDAPPAWATTQDPWGLSLVAALTLKEVPFLLWAAATQLQRADTGGRWARELDVARAMGYGDQAAWWRVVWPQLWPRLGAPLLAVMAYSLTVVDMALVIGPASPPTAAVLAWQWLLDADPAVNAMGAAGAWLVALVTGGLAAVLWLLRGHLHRRAVWTSGMRGAAGRHKGAARWPALLLSLPYLGVMLALAVGSVSGVWQFPALLPQTLSLQGWSSVVASVPTLIATLALAAASGVFALAWSVAWLECAPPAWDQQLRRLVYLPLLLPSVLWVVGIHRLSLAWQVDGQWPGLLLAHSLAALPYVLIALSPAYAGFDARYAQVAASLGHGRLEFLIKVKWPLLRASLLAALAVGVSVSVAQYLPTLFIGAGRFATVTTEAVALASGGQRSLLAAYAWLQWLIPAVTFALAAWLGRPRRFRRRLP